MHVENRRVFTQIGRNGENTQVLVAHDFHFGTFLHVKTDSNILPNFTKSMGGSAHKCKSRGRDVPNPQKA